MDFGYVGRLYDPRTRVMRKAWVFVMVLGYSRHMFARIAFDQTTETWLRLHVEAFEELGGVVEVVVPDNLKAAVVRAAFGVDGGTALNRSYRELARHYGFKVDPTPVYERRPRDLGFDRSHSASIGKSRACERGRAVTMPVSVVGKGSDCSIEVSELQRVLRAIQRGDIPLAKQVIRSLIGRATATTRLAWSHRIPRRPRSRR